MLPDLIVHARLRKLWFVYFIVAISPVANQVYQDVFFELHAVVQCKSHNSIDILYAFSIDVHDWNAKPLDDV